MLVSVSGRPTGGANRHCDCDGYRPDKLGGGIGQARFPFGVIGTSKCELDSIALASDDSEHFFRGVIRLYVLGCKYVVGLHRKAVPEDDKAVVIGFAEQLVRLALPDEFF